MITQFSHEKKNIKLGVIISYITILVSVVFSLLFQRFLLNSPNVGEEQFGLYSFVNSIISWLSLLTFGISSSYIRFATLSLKDSSGVELKRINGVYLTILFIASVLCLVISGIVFSLLFYNIIDLSNYSDSSKKIIVILFGLSALLTVVSFVYSFGTLFVTLNSRFIVLRCVELFSKLLYWGLSVLLILIGMNIIAVAISNLAVQLIFATFIWLYSKFKLKLNISFVKFEQFKQYIKPILSFSIWIFINIIIDQINNNIGKTILGFTVDATAVTVFTLGFEIYSYAMLMSTAVSNNYVSSINRSVANENYDEVNETFLYVSKLQLIVLSTVIGGFISCGFYFVKIWLGNGVSYQSSVFFISVILLLSCIVPFSQNICIEIQRAMNMHKFRSILYLCMSCLNIGLTALFVYLFEYSAKPFGAAISLCIVNLLGTWLVINIFYAKKLRLRVAAYFKYLVLIACPALLIGGLIFAISRLLLESKINNVYLSFLINGFAFVIIYGALLLIYWKSLKLFEKKRI